MVQDPREYSDEAIWGVVGVGGVEGVLNVKLLVGNWKMMYVIGLVVHKRIVVTDGNKAIAIVC